MTDKEIGKICERFNITNYSINNDKSIDVDDDVDFMDLYSDSYLEEFPINFNVINGEFNCFANKLNSLKGAPTEIHGDFDAGINNLNSLEYFPKYIKGNIFLRSNNLESLKFLPKNINGVLDIANNNIRNFSYFPNVKEIFYLNNNPIQKLWLLFENFNFIEYFNELDIIQENDKKVILERLNYFLIDIGENELSEENPLFRSIKDHYNIK